MKPFVYALVLLLDNTGIAPENHRAMTTVPYQLQPNFHESIACQNAAQGINKNIRGEWFKNEQIKGQIVGAWCIVPVAKK